MRRPLQLCIAPIIFAASTALVAASAVAADAQAVASTIRLRVEAAPGAPLSGALVALVDQSNQVAAEGLSSESGHSVLSVPDGSYRVRVRRIGFRPFLSEVFTVPRTDEILLRIETDRVVLTVVLVSASAHCGPINPDAQALASVWEEVEKALRSSQLTSDDLSSLSRVHSYRREVGLDGAVYSSDSTTAQLSNMRPFGAVDPASLVQAGYVRGDEQQGWDFFAPDERVLLSSDFAATHCFRVVRDEKRRADIGVAFEPAPKRRLTDIKGVLWLDEATSELREVRFRFVNAGMLTRFEPGGFARFRRMPSGAWIVDEWQVRMPRLQFDRGALTAVSYIEKGGRVVTAIDSRETTIRRR